MGYLCLYSSPISANPISYHMGSLKICNPLSKTSTFYLQHFLPSPYLKCSLGSHHLSKTLAGNGKSVFELTKLDHSLHLSASQVPPSAMRGFDGDVMGMLLRERVVFLGSEINDFVADVVISQLLLLDAQDPTKDIRLFINSPGGSLSATLALYDVTRLVRADVSTVAMGIAASTASLILGGGTKGKRLAMPNARIMMHQPLGGASGYTSDVEIQTKELMQNKATVISIISDFTGRTLEQVEKDIDRDCFMSPIEAVEYGMIDGVIDRESIISLMPVPDPLTLTSSSIKEKFEDPKFITPDVPDDEIY